MERKDTVCFKFKSISNLILCNLVYDLKSGFADPDKDNRA